MLSMINRLVEPTLIDLTKSLLKPRSMIADIAWIKWFKDEYFAKYNVETMSIMSEGRVLSAQKIQLNQSQETPPLKIAIVYMCGNGDFVAHALPSFQPLLNDVMTQGLNIRTNVEYTVYCQDYRGKGFNQKDENENFNDYSLFQDAKDQAALIKTLLDDGFFPENIFVVGHSLGSAVAFWAVDILKNNLNCKQIKIFSDRGYGNLLDFPYVKPFLSDQKCTNEKLTKSGMMPATPLHDIAVNLPNSFIYRVENDGVIVESISLANTVKQNEIRGRTWVSEAKAEKKENPHNVSFGVLQSVGIPELKPHHFMTAIIHQLPIKLNFNFKLPRYSGYALSKDAKNGDSDFIEIPQLLTELKNTEAVDIKRIVIEVSNVLVTELDQYIKNKADTAAKSGYGGAYKKGLLGLVGWTAKEQLQLAVRLMVALCDQYGPNIEALNKIISEDGPHQSGVLNGILKKIIKLKSDIEQLQFFNQWIKAMPEQRIKPPIPVFEQPQSLKTENSYSRFFRPALVGLGTLVGGLATYGLGGAAMGAATGYFAPEAAELMRGCCKKN